MRSVLFDSSIYIEALRSGNDRVLSLRKSLDQSVWLSSVVLEELYAGSTSRDHNLIERLERDFDRATRILVPNLNDWTRAGKILSRIAVKYDYEVIGRSRITNDALIAVSAGRNGVTIFTANQRDFARLAEFSPFSWKVWVG